MIRSIQGNLAIRNILLFNCISKRTRTRDLVIYIRPGEATVETLETLAIHFTIVIALEAIAISAQETKKKKHPTPDGQKHIHDLTENSSRVKKPEKAERIRVRIPKNTYMIRLKTPPYTNIIVRSTLWN